VHFVQALKVRVRARIVREDFFACFHYAHFEVLRKQQFLEAQNKRVDKGANVVMLAAQRNKDNLFLESGQGRFTRPPIGDLGMNVDDHCGGVNRFILRLCK
jgi:hypothetical protein